MGGAYKDRIDKLLDTVEIENRMTKMKFNK